MSGIIVLMFLFFVLTMAAFVYLRIKKEVVKRE